MRVKSRPIAAMTGVIALACAIAPSTQAQLTDQQIIDAFFSSDPAVDCSPFLTGVSVTTGDDILLQSKTTYGAASFPTEGVTFLVLSSGHPDAPAEIKDLDFPPEGCDGDNVQVTFTFDFPDDGSGASVVQSLGFNFDFFSYEFPDFVGAGFNDYALAYLDAAPIVLDADCNAPVPPPLGCLITFDSLGNPTNVDSAFFQGCDVIGCDNPSGTPGWDNVFNFVPGDDAGRTGTLTTCSPVECAGPPIAPGTHTLTLIVGDAGDGVFTSVGIFDNLQCFADLECDEPVTSVCGNDTAEPGEDCDGTDDAACPGMCDANCLCPVAPLEGACCDNGPGTQTDCIVATQVDCEGEGGLFLGNGTECTDEVDCFALLVTFDSMGAKAYGDGVRVSWTTATEIDTVGFRVLREDANGRLKSLNQVGAVVPSAGSSLEGASYMVLDDSAESGRAQRYYLEDIDRFGRVTRHGPIEVVRGSRQLGSRTERSRTAAVDR